MTFVPVRCGNSEPVWKAGIISGLKDEIDIWKITPTGDPDLYKYLELLSEPEKEQASRFYQKRDRRNFITRRGVLRILIGQYLSIPPSDVQFATGRNKRPIMDPASNKTVYFNTSGSGDLILISIGNSETGVDIEKNDPAFVYDDLLDECFSDREIEFIKHSESPRDDFYRLWTRKEALTKATSKGLDDDIMKIPSLDGIHQVGTELIDSTEGWQVTSFWADETHQGSVACQAKYSALRFYIFP